MTTSEPGRSSTRDLAFVAVFAGIIAALAAVPPLYVLGMSVPITAQTLGVMLAGAVLGARRGALSVLLLLVLVAVGLPLLAGGRGGLGVFAEPSVGFLVGFPFAAYVTGWLTERAGAPYSVALGVVANIVGGVVVLYAFGIPGLWWRADLTLWQATTGSAVFLPGDLAKAVVAALVARGVHAAYPGLIRRRRRRAEEPSPA